MVYNRCGFIFRLNIVLIALVSIINGFGCVSKKIFNYVAYSFIKSMLIFHLAFCSFIFVADFADNLRRTDNPIKLILSSLMKIPHILPTIAPFIVMLASFYSIRMIVLRKELDIYKSFGIPIWQFLYPFFLITILWSIVIMFAITPLSVFLYEKEDKILQKEESQQIALSTDYFWMIDKTAGNDNIIAAKSIKEDPSNKDMFLDSVAFLEIKNNKFQGAVFANSAKIENFVITFNNAITRSPGKEFPIPLREVKKNISIQSQNISNLSAPYDKVYIWNFPNLIYSLKKINLNARAYEVHFYNILSLPILMISLLLISLYFALYDIRKGRNIYAVFATIICGFAIYFFLNFMSVFALNTTWSALLIILYSKILMLLLSVNVIYKKEGL